MIVICKCAQELDISDLATTPLQCPYCPTIYYPKGYVNEIHKAIHETELLVQTNQRIRRQDGIEPAKQLELLNVEVGMSQALAILSSAVNPTSDFKLAV
jgi:hypothetical protein